MDGLPPAGFSISGVCVERTLLTVEWLMPRVEAICLVEWPELSRERMLLRVSEEMCFMVMVVGVQVMFVCVLNHLSLLRYYVNYSHNLCSSF